MKQLVIFGNTYQQDDTTRVLALLKYLRGRGLEVAVEHDYLQYLCNGAEHCDYASFHASEVPDADMALSLGGDGTFLTTGRHSPSLGAQRDCDIASRHLIDARHADHIARP